MSRLPIIILGGGISGLAAAQKLLEQNIRVVLLEAKAELGGRMRSIASQHGPLELGAEFIHGRNPTLLAELRQARLTARQISEDHKLAVGGKLREFPFFDKIGEVVDSIQLRERDIAFGKLVVKAKLDRKTRNAALDYASGFEAADPNRISSHSLLYAQYAAAQMDGEWQGHVVEGYKVLIDAMRGNILRRDGKILTEAIVSQVKWKPGNATVSFSHRGKKQTVSGGAAVITLPLGVWKTGKVVFAPALKEKDRAVREMGFGNVAKVILVFRRKWWPAAFRGFAHATETPFPTWWTAPRGPILTGWAGGTRADPLIRLPPKQLLKCAIASLAKIFAIKDSAIQDELVEMYSHDWAGDPFSRGAYSYIPVNGVGLPKILAQPLQRTLYFAGEATVSDCQTGTVFGALESGYRAAKELLADRNHAAFPPSRSTRPRGAQPVLIN